MKYLSFALSIFLISANSVFSQVGINTDNSIPAASAMLDVKSNSKGVLVPRMSTADRNAIILPAKGLLVYDTTTSSFFFFNGGAWQNISGNTTANQITDADNDTKVQVESIADEDKIRFKTANFEQLVLDGKSARLQSPGNSLFIGLDAGLIDDGSENQNLFIGLNAGKDNVTGSGNTFIGQSAGRKNTTHNNTFIGNSSGFNNTSGSGNTFVGETTGFNNSTGFSNTFIGATAGQVNTTASNNTFLGHAAGGVNTTGANNTMLGQNAGASNTTASNNTFLGQNAGTNNITGFNNTFVGEGAGDANTIADHNTFLGKDAGGANTTGTSNTFIGKDAGKNNTDENDNVYIGGNAGLNSSGNSNILIGVSAGSTIDLSNNVMIGNQAGLFLNYGFGNVFLGSNCGSSDSTYRSVVIGQSAANFHKGFENVILGFDAAESLAGNENVIIGTKAGFGPIGDIQESVMIGKNAFVGHSHENSVALGANSLSNADNKVRLGGGFVTTVEGQVAYSFPSDGRFKFNVEENVPGVSFIEKLRPVTYRFDLAKYLSHIYPVGWNDSLTITEAENQKEKLLNSSQTIHTGFIAQEVEDAAKEIGYDFHGVVLPQNEKDNYGLRYAEFVVPLVKAVQELSAENTNLKTELGLMKKGISNLMTEIESLKNMPGHRHGK